MKVCFSTIDDFLHELITEHNAGRVDEWIVRLCIDKTSVNGGTQRVSLTAGFLSMTELREFSEVCGDDFLRSKQEGSERAQVTETALRECCRRLNESCTEEGVKLEVRGGKFEVE